MRQGAGEECPKLQRLQPQPVTIIRDVPRVPTVVERHGAHRLEGEGMRDHCGRKLHSICQPLTALTDCAGTSVASFRPDKNKRQKKPRTRRVKAQEEHVRRPFPAHWSPEVDFRARTLSHGDIRKHLSTKLPPFFSAHQGHSCLEAFSPPRTLKSPCSVSPQPLCPFLSHEMAEKEITVIKKK